MGQAAKSRPGLARQCKCIGMPALHRTGGDPPLYEALAEVPPVCKAEMERDLLSLDACDANLDTWNRKTVRAPSH
jgi:hypothetical protein